MYTTSPLFSARNSYKILVPLLLQLMLIPSLSAEVSIEYQVIARSGVTPIPDGAGTFDGFNVFPAVDSSGNVMFGGYGLEEIEGQMQVGIYTAIGACCQKVVDRSDILPRGDNFWTYDATDQNDIDGGRVAFRAYDRDGGETLYTNVGQASASDLVEVVTIDGVDWSQGGEPWADGDRVAMWGKQQPINQSSILLWDGFINLLDPGSGYGISLESQASISGEASIFQRYRESGFNTDIVIATGGAYEILAEENVTPMPGDESKVFLILDKWPVVDRGGLDAAFQGIGSEQKGVYKRVDGGPLQRVADKSTTVPTSGSELFTYFEAGQLALANGFVAFVGRGTDLVDGIFTDVGEQLSVVVDTLDNSIIELDGEAIEISAFRMGTKSFALTPQGYTLVFLAYEKAGGSVLIRATITNPDDGLPGMAEGSPPTSDFESGSADGWLLNGDVAIDGNLAMGQYSLRHANRATSMLSVSTAGYKDISVTMHLAATSLKKRDGCFAEVSTDGGNSWLPVIEVHDGNDDGTFYSGTVYPPGADDNSDLQLRFRASGNGKKGNCYGDDVTVLGTPVGGVESAP